ncbi:MAG: methylmalonyl-CoA epimerase [Acidobacteria bacterium]|nr:MAG: methylmalonyl-CoA epimerase [Acidobacteriota bacterium]
MNGLDHIGVAVRDPARRSRFWSELLGLALERVEEVPEEGVRTWFLESGGLHVELLEPLGEDTPVGRHLSRRGEGLHHVCLGVGDIEAMAARLSDAGIVPIGGVRDGARGARVAFLHPKDTGGVLIELSERPDRGDSDRLPAVAVGDVVVACLKEPRERLLGILCRLDETGVVLDAIPVDAWEDWVAQWRRGGNGPLAPTLQFVPMGRLERLLADRDQPALGSFERRFRERTGRSLRASFGRSGGEP